MGVAMRGDDRISGGLLSYIDLEKRVRVDRPLRAIREIANTAFDMLSRDFAAFYSGRPSIPRGSCCGRCCCGVLLGALGAPVDGAD